MISQGERRFRSRRSGATGNLMARKLAYLLMAFTVTLCSSAYALGLGGIESRSTLNQPLSARIPLHAVQPDELDSIRVNLASAEAFARAGVERPFHLSKLRFEVTADNGSPVILITSREPITEPFLDFLIEVSWPRGRMVREYTLLLDPPVFAEEERALPAPAPARSPAMPEAAVPRARPAVANARRPASAEAPRPTGHLNKGEYIVREGETLWRVANHVRPDQRVGVHQTMLALVKANPDAFLDGDPTRLKSGAVLRVPERAEITRVRNSAALREIERLIAAHQTSSAAVATPTPASAPEAAPAPAGSRLQVVAASESGTGASGGSSLDEEQRQATAERIRALERELALVVESQLNLQAENEDLKQQIIGLKEEIASLERLINLRAVQAPADAMPGQETRGTATDSSFDRVIAGATPEPASPMQKVAESPRSNPAVTPAVLPSGRAATPEAATEPSLLDLLEEPLVLPVLGGAAAVLAGLVLLVIRRRRLAAAAPVTIQLEPDSSESEPGSAPAEDQTLENGAAADDPLSEADVYLAYGRYDQAQATVIAALEQTPERTDLRLKLLEIFALTENRAGFEEHVQILHSQVGGEGEAWARAVELGREVAPEHPFFSTEDAFDQLDLTDSDDASLTSEEFVLDDGAAQESGLAEGEAAGQAAAKDDMSLDFDLDVERPAAQDAASNVMPVEGVEADDALEFDIDFATAPEPGAEGAELDEFAFELPEDQSLQREEQGAEFDMALEFDLDTDPASEGAGNLDLAGEGTEDEVATKLDLARAYLEMGDAEGARELLEEVMEEGNAAQREAADQMLRRAS